MQEKEISMPKIERYICISYNGIVYEHINCCDSDEKARREAIFRLEKRLGKMRGGLMKHFKNNPDDIWGVNGCI